LSLFGSLVSKTKVREYLMEEDLPYQYRGT